MATELEATMNQEVQPKKKGLFGRLRLPLGKKKGANEEEQRDPTPSPNQKSGGRNLDTPTTVAHDADFPAPVAYNKISPEEIANEPNERSPQMKAVRFPVSDAMKTNSSKVGTPRGRKELLKPPTAREAAYGGPPRYDWIDIVSERMYILFFGAVVADSTSAPWCWTVAHIRRLPKIYMLYSAEDGIGFISSKCFFSIMA